jgi:hypothetical protein
LINWSRNGPANPVPRPGWRVVSSGGLGCGGDGWPTLWSVRRSQVDVGNGFPVNAYSVNEEPIGATGAWALGILRRR